MSHSVISVERVSKLYRVGSRLETPDTLVKAAIQYLTLPFTNLRRIAQLDVAKLLRRQTGNDLVGSDLRGIAVNDSSQFGSKHFGKDDPVLWALRDVSFRVGDGEVIGIIGRNGAGKSTLLKILSRITEPSAGKVVIHGRVASLLEVGTGFHPELTGRENVYMNGTLLGMTKREIDRRFDEIVDFSGVEDFLDTPIKHFSSGMTLRLAFSVAAHLDPEVLLIDEVLAVGDANFQEKCTNKMGRVAEEGRTVLFVSHNLGAIQQLCDRTIVIREGCVAYDGDTPTAITNYMSDAAASEWSAATTAETHGEVHIDRICVGEPCKSGSADLDDDHVVVEIYYTVNEPVSDLLLGVDFVSVEGIPVFRSYDLEEVGMGKRAPGSYLSRLAIPSSFLRPGTYIVELLAAVHRRYWISRGQVRLKYVLQKAARSDVHYSGSVYAPGKWQVQKLADKRCVG